MAEYPIKSLKFGLDTRRDVLTSVMGTLVTCDNMYVNAGGELEKRKAFDQTYDVSMFDNDALSISITRSGTTATATLASHGLAVGDEVKIAGATQSEYNGIQTVTAITTNTFSYTVSGSPATPATGSPTASFVGTFGLEDTGDGLVVFGSAYVSGASPITGEPSLASAIPSGVTYAQLRHPGVGQYQDGSENSYNYRYHRMKKVIFSLNFNGEYWVAAQFVDGRTFIYYNSSTAISSSWNGLVLEDSASFGFVGIAAINLGRQLSEFGWVDPVIYALDTDLNANVDENGAVEMGSYILRSPAGDFFGVQTDWDSDAGQIGVKLLDTDGPGANGVRALCAIQITANGTVALTAPPVGSTSPTLALTGGTVSAGADATATATAVAQAVNDFSDYTGYQAIASADVIIVFAPINFDTSGPATPPYPDIQLTTAGTATIASSAGSSTDVVGILTPTPLEVVRQVPMPGQGWMVSGEVQLYVFGGVPPYTFAWSEMSVGTGNGITIEDPDDSTTSFSKAIPENTEVTGQFKCLITSQGGITETVYLTVTLKATYTSGQ